MSLYLRRFTVLALGASCLASCALVFGLGEVEDDPLDAGAEATADRDTQPVDAGDAALDADAASPIDPDADIVSLSAGFFVSCAISTSGALYCWGSNQTGMLGRQNVLETCEQGGLPNAPCYERVGRLSSAWKTFRDLESVLVRVDDKERAATVHARIAALEGRSPRIKIVNAPDRSYPGLVILLDEVAVDRARLGTAEPVDPGAHTIAFQAPRRHPQTISVNATAAEVREVQVPLLEDDAPPRIRGDADPGRARRTLAWIVGGTGLAALGAGVVLGVLAKSSYDDATAGCTLAGDVTRCATPGSAARADDARRTATIGTIVGAVGVTAIAAGVVVWLTAPKRESARTARALTVSPFGLGGTF